MAIVDSSVIIHITKNTELGKKVIEQHSSQLNSTTVFTIHEVLVGYGKNDRAKAMSALSALLLLDFDLASVEKSVLIEDELRKKGRLINQTDIFIAAICLQNNEPIITCDKDFLEIEGLEVILIE